MCCVLRAEIGSQKVVDRVTWSLLFSICGWRMCKVEWMLGGGVAIAKGRAFAAEQRPPDPGTLPGPYLSQDIFDLEAGRTMTPTPHPYENCKSRLKHRLMFSLLTFIGEAVGP